MEPLHNKPFTPASMPKSRYKLVAQPGKLAKLVKWARPTMGYMTAGYAVNICLTIILWTLSCALSAVLLVFGVTSLIQLFFLE